MASKLPIPLTMEVLRKNKSLTQLDLAEKLSTMCSRTITQTEISYFENGVREPSIEVIESLSTIFNVEMDILMRPINEVDLV